MGIAEYEGSSPALVGSTSHLLRGHVKAIPADSDLQIQHQQEESEIVPFSPRHLWEQVESAVECEELEWRNRRENRRW